MYTIPAIIIGCALMLSLAMIVARKQKTHEACSPQICIKCGSADDPVDVQGKLYCVACIRKNRKSMGEYRPMPWHGGCKK